MTGAAVATNIGRGTAVALPVLSRSRAATAACDSRAAHLTARPVDDGTVLRLSGSGTLQILIGTASYVGLVRILSMFGSAALAGYTIGIRADHLRAAAVVRHQQRRRDDGRAEPRRRPSRSRRARRCGPRRCTACSFSARVGLVFLAAAPADRRVCSPAIRRSQPYAVSCLRIVSLGFVFYAYGMVLTQSFNGAGDTWTPTMINLFMFWLWEIPLAWWLATQGGLGARASSSR